jgi:ABC-type multidrug transport system fused ATPase/permease subunit
MIGLILTYSINLQNNLVHGLQNTTQLENSLIGFERCLKLIECPSEKPMVEENDEKLKNWPENGKIEFKNFSTRYRPDTDIVLKNINFNVKGNEKIGIVGRTGSGKSTITLCLFRILEPVEGNINIDDIDITTIGLKKLRSNITIIPQDPAIFSGTLRYNIDPLNLVTDDEIKLVMSKIKFDYIINKNSAGLYQDIAENGSNLSVGEKQLICICRAILRRSKIIVMDEATASIDFQTEEIIQNAINEIMKNSTVLTIAHRIKTIIKYDKILVLDNGEIKDFDSPEILKNKKDGIFYELYKKSGA